MQPGWLHHNALRTRRCCACRQGYPFGPQSNASTGWATPRYPQRYSEDLAKWIQVGASPRGSLALDRTARVSAWLAGRDHVTPDDVRAVAHDCLRHRLMLSYEANAAGMTAHKVVSEIVKVVAVA